MFVCVLKCLEFVHHYSSRKDLIQESVRLDSKGLITSGAGNHSCKPLDHHISAHSAIFSLMQVSPLVRRGIRLGENKQSRSSTFRKLIGRQKTCILQVVWQIQVESPWKDPRLGMPSEIHDCPAYFGMHTANATFRITSFDSASAGQISPEMFDVRCAERGLAISCNLACAPQTPHRLGASSPGTVSMGREQLLQRSCHVLYAGVCVCLAAFWIEQFELRKVQCIPVRCILIWKCTCLTKNVNEGTQKPNTHSVVSPCTFQIPSSRPRPATYTISWNLISLLQLYS